jgi:hypothetical protein
MTLTGRLFPDHPIRVNPRHPRNPCSIVALLFAKAHEICNSIYLQFAQITNLRSSAFICCSFFANAPETKIPTHKGTRMTRIKWIFPDHPLRVNPRHPRNPCSIVAFLFAKAPEISNAIYPQFAQTINLRSSAFICGSVFANAPDSYKSQFIKRINLSLRSLRWCSC